MRTLTSARRSAVVSVLAFLLVVAGAQVAHACSCLIGDPRDALHRSDGAFVGTLVERTEVDEQTSIFTFEVETAVKGTIGATIDVRSNSNGASCGLEVEIGQRIGLLLGTDEDGAWISNLCSQIDPEVLLNAAEPLPEPDGVGPVRFVVGGNLGENRLMALDRTGRTLAYGPGDGYARDVDICPGATRVLEAVTLGRRAQLVVRDLPSLDVVRTITLAETRRPWLPHAECLSANGGRLLAVERHKTEYWIHQVTGTTDHIAWHGHVRDVVIQDGRAYVIDGLELFEVNLRAGRLEPLAPIPAHVQGITISPDGSTDRRVRVRAVRGHRADAIAGRQHPRRGRPHEEVRVGGLRVRRGGVGERPHDRVPARWLRRSACVAPERRDDAIRRRLRRVVRGGLRRRGRIGLRHRLGTARSRGAR